MIDYASFLVGATCGGIVVLVWELISMLIWQGGWTRRRRRPDPRELKRDANDLEAALDELERALAHPMAGDLVKGHQRARRELSVPKPEAHVDRPMIHGPEGSRPASHETLIQLNLSGQLPSGAWQDLLEADELLRRKWARYCEQMRG